MLVAGEVDDVTRVGVDAEQPGHLHRNAGLLDGLADGRVGYGLGHLDRAAGQLTTIATAAGTTLFGFGASGSS
jgi:hypothetical protein